MENQTMLAAVRKDWIEANATVNYLINTDNVLLAAIKREQRNADNYEHLYNLAIEHAKTLDCLAAWRNREIQLEQYLIANTYLEHCYQYTAALLKFTEE